MGDGGIILSIAVSGETIKINHICPLIKKEQDKSIWRSGNGGLFFLLTYLVPWGFYLPETYIKNSGSPSSYFKPLSVADFPISWIKWLIYMATSSSI